MLEVIRLDAKIHAVWDRPRIGPRHPATWGTDSSPIARGQSRDLEAHCSLAISALNVLVIFLVTGQQAVDKPSKPPITPSPRDNRIDLQIETCFSYATHTLVCSHIPSWPSRFRAGKSGSDAEFWKAWAA